MSTNSEMTLMKRAALEAVLKCAIKSGSVTLTKTAAEQRQRMALFLKHAGVNKREVVELTRSIKAAAQIPSQKAFEKIAKDTGLKVSTVKLAYLSKRADLATLAGGGLGALGGMALGGGRGAAVGGLIGAGLGNLAGQVPSVLSHAMNPYQMSPERRALYQRIQNEATGNKRLSQDLQAMSGAFRPAANPWGPGQAQ